MENNKKNAVLVASSNWNVVDSVNNGRVRPSRPKRMYACVFGRYVPIDKAEARILRKEGFEIVYK